MSIAKKKVKKKKKKSVTLEGLSHQEAKQILSKLPPKLKKRLISMW